LLYKKVLSKNEVFKNLPAHTIQLIMETVVAAVLPERKFTFLKRAAEILVQIYINQDAYLPFFELMGKYENAQDEKIKLFVLYALELLAEFSFDEGLLIQHSGEFTKWFEKFMADESVGVRVGATASLSSFLSCIQETSHIMKFEGVLPTLLTLLIEAIKDDEEKGLKVIKSFEDLINSHPKFVKKQLEEILNVFTEILMAQNLSEGIRNASIMCLATVATRNPVPCRKSKTFSEKTIAALMNAMLEQPDDLNEWLTEYEENSLEKNSVSANAVECLPRFAEGLGVKFLLPKIIAYAFQFINNDDWKYKYAGLMGIGMLVEGSSAHFDKDFDNLMK
jgi:hypothetical protein